MMTLNIDVTLLIINSFFIYGLNYALGSPVVNHEGDKVIFSRAILSSIGEFLYKRIETLSNRYSTRFMLLSPMVLCTTCMSSLWGGAFYFLFSHQYSIQDLCVYVVALAGLNRLLKNFV